MVTCCSGSMNTHKYEYTKTCWKHGIIILVIWGETSDANGYITPQIYAKYIHIYHREFPVPIMWVKFFNSNLIHVKILILIMIAHVHCNRYTHCVLLNIKKLPYI